MKTFRAMLGEKMMIPCKLTNTINHHNASIINLHADFAESIVYFMESLCFISCQNDLFFPYVSSIIQ